MYFFLYVGLGDVQVFIFVPFMSSIPLIFADAFRARAYNPCIGRIYDICIVV